jgi:hypothetical protein
MKETVLKDLKDEIKMKGVLRTRGNLSAPGLAGITNTLLKLEREKGAKMLIKRMKMVLNMGFGSAFWKIARTILLYKEGKKKNQPIGDQLQLQMLFLGSYFAKLHLHYRKGPK